MILVLYMYSPLRLVYFVRRFSLRSLLQLNPQSHFYQSEFSIGRVG